MEQDTNLQNQAVDPQRNLVTKLINHYEPNLEVTDDYYKSISEKYQDVDTLVTKLINHYEPKAEVTTDYLNGLYSKYDVKKKEQTEPTQAAPLPGLGGVSEEPTPSPYIGRSLLEGEGLGAIIPTKESRALSEYEKNQKAISEIDKRISTGDMSKLPIKERMLFGGIESKISEDIDGLKRRRDSLVKKSDSLIPEARKVIDEIVSSEISGGKYQEFLTEDGTAVDPTKAGDFAREKALEYGLPDDGYFFDLVRNSIESNVESNRIKERVDKNFNDIMQEKHGMGVDDYVKSVVEKSADATGITKLVGERDLAIANVYDNISTLAKNEVEKIQVDRYGKTAEEYASDIRRQYESQVSAINERYSGLMVDGQFTGTQQQFESYKADFESISKAAQEQIDQIVSQEIKDVAAVNAKYDLRYKRQADEIARMYAEKIDEKAKLVDPIIKKEIESAYKSAVGKVYEDEDKAKKAAAVYAAESYLGPAGVVASFVSKPFTKSILDQTSTYLRAAGLQELSETAKLYAKSVDIGEFKLDNADDFLDPLNVIGATGQTIGGMVPTLAPSIAVGVATGGIGWLPTLAAGATGWTVESVGIAQDAYDDRFAATGSVSEAEEARDKAWKAQTLILPAYALDNFPIFGKIAGGTAKRIALGALAEYGTELLQEYPQNVFEEVIRNDENLSEAMKYVSFDGFKRTASNLTPVLLIGAGGQARQISAENNIKNAAATLSAKMNIGNMTDSSLEQYMLYLTASKGSDFALAFVDAQLRTGNIAEDVAEKSTNAINNSKSFIDKTRNLKISNESKLALASFDLKIRNAKERVEAETDPMLKSVEETKLKQLEKQASELATTGTTDYAVVAFKNNTFEILTPQELEVMSNNENFISSFSNGDIEVEMFGKNQKQMSDMLNEKVKQEPVAEEDGVNYIESLDDNELVTFNVETIEEVPDKFKEKAVKRDDLSVDVREKILGLPIGKKKKVTVKDGGYSYTITGLEAKEYAKEQQETVPTETKEAAPIEPSGFNPNDNIFNKPELKKNTNYGWRSMGEGEFNELSLGNKIYEGGKPKQGNWISGVPESASEHGGAGKIMVEFGNIDIVGGESMSKGAKAGKDNVTKVWKYNDSTKKFEEAPELLDKLRKSETISESVDSKIAKKESDLQKEVDDFYDYELPSLEKSFPSGSLIKSYEQYKELGEDYGILTKEQRDVVDKIESRKEEIDSIYDILADLTNGDITLDEAISKYNNLKPKQDAIQEQAAGEVPVQPKAKAGEKVEEGKPEAEPGKPTEKGKEEVSEEEVNKVADTTGTKPKNIRDLYNINRDMFGQDRVKSLASAIVMDRAIAVMAKRAGISKSEMYSRLQFNKAENVPDGVKFQVDAWHGSPYMFDRFSTQFVGKGVGAMRTGWGLYFTKNEQRTINYAKELSASTIKIGDRVFKDRDKFSGDMFEKINDILEKSNGSRLYVVKQLLEISNRERKKGEKLKEDYRKRLSKEELESGEYDYPLWTETDHYEYRRLAKDVLRSGIEKKDYPSYVYNVAIQENGNWLDFDAVVPDNQYNAILDQAKKENSRFLNEIEKRKGKTGLELYFGVANNFNNNPERELSLLMSRAGIDGNIGRHDTDTEYVVFDENAVSIEEVIKFQKDAEKARGAAMVNMDGTAVIYAMTDPNVSTPLHEIAHVFEHYLTDAERKAIMKFAGTKEWSVETSEKFARGFEKYLADGIAPTAELQKIFDKFKQWMLDIYNGITGSDIDIQLNDEMRDIYDKMLGKEPVAAKTESEKVKAAKDNLNNVWEKWKQSQKNLGVVFDPKSKANEDMELLEAFLTYIKALGIKTAKDIQKAFNDFTGGEATLDDAGAEFVSESVKEPVTKKTEKELSREVTFTNIYDIIEKVNKRTPKKANPKEVNKRAYRDAYDYLLKSDWFASATDIEQTEAIDDLKKLTGQRRESSPSAQKILGIDTTKEKISVDQKTVRGWMMKDLAEGYKLGKRDAKKVMAAMATLKTGLQRELVAAMREIQSSGKLSKKQVDAIVNKFQKTNVFNPDAVETFLNYIQKVIDNADYVEAVKTANTTRKQIKRRMKNKDVDNNLVQAAKEFAKINPSKVDDINAYNQLAEKIKEGLGFSMNSKQGVKFRSAFDISTVEEYSELELKRQKLASDAAFEEMFKEMFGSDFGMTVSEMRDFYAELDKETEKDEVKDKETRAKQAMSGAVKAFDTYSAIINEMLESGVDPFTGEDLDVDSKTKELIKEFMDIDISKLPLKDALRSVDALNNFVVNQTTGGLESIVRKRRGEENVNKLVKDGVRSFKLKLPFGSGKTWATGVVEAYLNSFASLPNLMDNLFGGVRKGLKVENAIGLSDVINGRAAANKKANQILEQFLDVFSDKEANGESFNTAANMTERGMLGFMRRTVLSTDEKLRKVEFERRKNLIKESIDRLKEGRKEDVEKAEIYEEVYNKILNESNSIEEIESKVDPVNKEAVEWWSKKFNEILPELTETSINVYNTVLENESNYNPDVYKRLKEQESELTELDDDSYNSNNGNEKVYDKENPMLMRVKKPSSLPKARYVSLDFDVNNFSAYEAALVDVNTAAAIKQLKGALESDAFNQLVPDYSDRKILKERITTYVAQIRRRGYVPFGSKTWNMINDASSVFARVGTATSLGGLLQPAKQTLPVFVNTLVNSGMSPEVFTSLAYVFDKDISNAINNSGLPIANRGVASQTTMDDIQKTSDKLSETTGSRLYNGIKTMQDKWMKIFLKNPDAFIARASFLVYYKQELKRKGINPSEIDWKNHKWNKEAANFAQRMVDRQQNVSDTDLQGLFLTDRTGAAPIIRKVLLPFQNFVLNQKNRMYADIKALQYGSKEDKSIAIKSLIGLSAEWASFTILSIAIQEGMYMAAEALISQFRGDDDDEEAKKKRAIEKERRRKMYIKSVGTSAFKDFVSPAPFVDQTLITAANYALEQSGATIDKGGLQFGVDFDKSMYEEYEKEVLDISDEELKLEKSIEYLNYIIEAQKEVDGEMYDVHIQKMNEFNERLKNGMEYQSRIRKDVERYMKKIEVEFKPFQFYGVGKTDPKMADMLGSVGIAYDRMDKTAEMFKQAATLEYETESFGRKTVKKIPKELQPVMYIAAVSQLAATTSALPSEFASTSNKIQKLVQKEAKTESQLEMERKDEIKKMIIDRDEFYKGYESGMYSAINAYSLREYKKTATELTDEEIMDVMYKIGY